MSFSTYAGLKERFEASDFSLSAVSGGNTAIATNLYYFVYGLTRAGINLETAMGQVAVQIGKKLEFTINATARPSGLDPFAFVLGAATTNDPTQSQVLTVAWVIDDNQETQRTLPLTVELNNDGDFVLDGTVNTFSSLPTPINGAIRLVSDQSTYYQYDSEGWYAQNGAPVWRQVYGRELYLANTTTLRSGNNWKGGCNAPIPNIPLDPQPEYYSIIQVPYTGSGEDSSQFKLWLTNGLSEGSGQIAPTDSQINLITKLNNSTELGSATLTNKVSIQNLKTIRLLDGLEVQNLVGSFLFSEGTPFYTLESDLLPGYALEVACTVSATIGNGDRISIYLRDDGVFGVPTTAVQLGEAVFKSEDENISQSFIVPDLLGVKRLSGEGQIITNNQSTGYFYRNKGELGLTQGIVADTANQKIAISGIRNGDITCYQNAETLPSTEALRAIISTETGTATASDWTTPITVGVNGSIEVTIALPTAIRDNYPDILIAGNTQGERDIPQMRVFVRRSGIITELSAIAVESDTEQTVIIDDLSAGTVITSVPSNENADFNLWGYESITTEAIGTGSLVADDYEVAIAWDYPSPNLSVTKISHSVNDGCVLTLDLTFARAIARSKYFSKVEIQGVLAEVAETLDFDFKGVRKTYDPERDRLRIQIPKLGLVSVLDRNPAPSDDSNSGYNASEFWVNSNNGSLYFSLDVSVGEAEWLNVGSGGGSGGGITAIADLAALKALTGINNDATYLLKANSTSGLNNNIYRYDSSSSVAGDDNAVIVPDTLPGRFLKVGKINSNEIVEVADKYFATAAQLAAIASNTTALGSKSDTNHTHVTQKGGLLTGDGTNQTVKPIGSNGKFLVSDSDEATGLNWVDPPQQAYTNTTASYTQPSIDSNVTLSVGSSVNFIATQYVQIETGGRYQVVSAPTLTTLIVTYKGGGVAETTAIASGRKIVPSGQAGVDGLSSQTLTTANFTVPAVNSTVTIDVETSELFNTETNINIESAGDYFITAINSPTQITARNLGGANNAIAGTTIASESQVIIIGKRGADGGVSATSSLNFTSPIAPPSTGAGEWKDFVDSTNSDKRSLRLPGDGVVKEYYFRGDNLPRLSLATTTEIATATDQVMVYYDGSNLLFKGENNEEPDKILLASNFKDSLRENWEALYFYA